MWPATYYQLPNTSTFQMPQSPWLTRRRQPERRHDNDLRLSCNVEGKTIETSKTKTCLRTWSLSAFRMCCACLSVRNVPEATKTCLRTRSLSTFCFFEFSPPYNTTFIFSIFYMFISYILYFNHVPFMPFPYLNHFKHSSCTFRGNHPFWLALPEDPW